MTHRRYFDDLHYFANQAYQCYDRFEDILSGSVIKVNRVFSCFIFSLSFFFNIFEMSKIVVYLFLFIEFSIWN